MKVVILVTVLALTACATAYQPNGFSGGFSDTALAPDTYRIVFRGNGMTDPERANDFALLRAADLALANGYHYFVILDSQDTVQHGAVYVPQTSYTTGSAYVNGNQVTGSAYTTTSGGYAIPINKPRTSEVVHFLKEMPADGRAFDAAFIEGSIRAKYQIK